MERKRFALIGSNIEYSLSPLIHNSIFNYYNMSGCEYDLIDIPPKSFREEISRIKSEYMGINVTIPYKFSVGEFVQRNFSPIRAINTLLVKNGEFVGYNTDIDGIRMTLEKIEIVRKLVKNVVFAECNAENYTKKVEATEYYRKSDNGVEKGGILAEKQEMHTDSILIIGAGGAAEAVIYALRSMGIIPQILARNGEKKDYLVGRYELKCYENSLPSIIINSTGRDMLRENLLESICLKRLEFVYDLSYNHEEMKAEFARRQIEYKDGMDMLIYQAIYAAKYLYNINVDGNIDKLFDCIKSKIFQHRKGWAK